MSVAPRHDETLNALVSEADGLTTCTVDFKVRVNDFIGNVDVALGPALDQPLPHDGYIMFN